MPEPIRVTDESDGELLNRSYSYWSQAFVQGDEAIAFCGHTDGQVRFFRVSLSTGQVERLGPLVPYTGTGEGWYFDALGNVYLCADTHLMRVHPFTGQTLVAMSVGDPGCRLFQAHSSDDGRTHSATVQRITSDGPYINEGTLVRTPDRMQFFPAQGTLDESQVTSDGRYLIIKENDDNRLVSLETGAEHILTDTNGAVGHSDVGPSFVVGEDNIRGQCVRWDLDTLARRDLFATWGMGHVSVKAGRCLLSGESHLSLVALDGSGVTPLIEHGMHGDGYDYQVQGNLSPCGRVAAYVSNQAGRFDLYLLCL